MCMEANVSFGNRGEGLHWCLFVHASTSPFKCAHTHTNTAVRCGAEVQNTVLVERTANRVGGRVESKQTRVFLFGSLLRAVSNSALHAGCRQVDFNSHMDDRQMVDYVCECVCVTVYAFWIECACAAFVLRQY